MKDTMPANSIPRTRMLMLLLTGVGCSAVICWNLISSPMGSAGAQGGTNLDCDESDSVVQFVVIGDESQYASRGLTPGISIREMGTNTVVAHYDYEAQFPLTFDASPSGDLIVVGYENRDVVAWAGTHGELRPRRIAMLKTIPVGSSVSADGQLVAFVFDDETIEILEVASGRVASRIVTGRDAIQRVRFAPNGRCLLTSDSTGWIGLWDTASNSLIHEYRAHKSSLRTLQWSKSGRRFVSGGNDSMACVWNRDDTNPYWTISDHDSTSLMSTISADGERIAIAGSSGIAIGDVASRTLGTHVSTSASQVQLMAFSKLSPRTFFYSLPALTADVHRVECSDFLPPPLKGTSNCEQ